MEAIHVSRIPDIEAENRRSGEIRVGRANYATVAGRAVIRLASVLVVMTIRRVVRALILVAATICLDAPSLAGQNSEGEDLEAEFERRAKRLQRFLLFNACRPILLDVALERSDM